MKSKQPDQGIKIISVGSSSKKAGKSTLATHLVRELGADFGLKVSTGAKHAPSEAITTDPDILATPGTDTGSLVAAGARTVLWVNAAADELASEIDRALGMLPGPGLAVIEGNSAIAHIHPDFTVFLMNVPFEEFKPSASTALSRADLVLVDTCGKLASVSRDVIEAQIMERAGDAQVFLYSGENGWESAAGKTVEVAQRRLALKGKFGEGQSKG